MITKAELQAIKERYYIEESSPDIPKLIEVLESAITVIKKLRYGEDDCFCHVSIGNPMFSGHGADCKQAMDFLKDWQ